MSEVSQEMVDCFSAASNISLPFVNHREQVANGLRAVLAMSAASSPNHADTGLVERAERIADEYCGGHHDDLSRHDQVRWNTAFNAARAALASIPGLERMDAMREAAVGMVAAWESLPGPKHYSADEVQRWISQQMKPAIDKVRKALSGDKA